MEKSWVVGVIEKKEVRGDYPIECFLSTEIRSTFWIPEGVMTIEVPQNEEVSGERKNGGGRKPILLFIKEE